MDVKKQRLASYRPHGHYILQIIQRVSKDPGMLLQIFGVKLLNVYVRLLDF